MMGSIFKDGAWERWGQDVVAVYKRLGNFIGLLSSARAPWWWCPCIQVAAIYKAR